MIVGGTFRHGAQALPMVAHRLRAQLEDAQPQKFAHWHNLQNIRELTPSTCGNSMSTKCPSFKSNFGLGARYVLCNFPSLTWSLSVRMVVVQMFLAWILSFTALFFPAHFELFVFGLCSLLNFTAHVSRSIFEFTVLAAWSAVVSFGFAALVVVYGLFLMVPLLFGRIAAWLGLITPARVALTFAKTIMYPPHLKGEFFLKQWEFIALRRIEWSTDCLQKLIFGGFSDEQGALNEQGVPSVLFFLAVRVLLLSPFFEELLFRSFPAFCQRCIKKAMEPVETDKWSNSPTRGEPLQHPPGMLPVFVRYPPMQILSSILFASLHVPRQSSPDYDGPPMIWLLVAVGRFTVPFFASLNILAPLYTKGHFAASLGAHVTWNLIMFGVYVLFLLVKSLPSIVIRY